MARRQKQRRQTRCAVRPTGRGRSCAGRALDGWVHGSTPWGAQCVVRDAANGAPSWFTIDGREVQAGLAQASRGGRRQRARSGINSRHGRSLLQQGLKNPVIGLRSLFLAVFGCF